MESIDRAFLTYKHLYTMLMAWVLRYCDEGCSHRVVAGAVSEGLHAAVNGFQTDNGPYQYIVDQVLRHLQMHDHNRKPEEELFPVQTVPAVDDAFLNDLAWLWAVSYEAFYRSNGYGRMLQDVTMTVSTADPRGTTAENLHDRLYERMDRFSALRYLVAEMSDGDQHGDLVCEIASDICEQEYRKAVAYKRSQPAPGGVIW